MYKRQVVKLKKDSPLYQKLPKEIGAEGIYIRFSGDLSREWNGTSLGEISYQQVKPQQSISYAPY